MRPSSCHEPFSLPLHLLTRVQVAAPEVRMHESGPSAAQIQVHLFCPPWSLVPAGPELAATVPVSRVIFFWEP
jgi:hypothetical protein